MASLLNDREKGSVRAMVGDQRERLTDRELQVVKCVGRGLSTREIAEELFISVKTVEAHREHIKSKLGLVSSGELLRYAIERNRLDTADPSSRHA
jgi:two-component system response regulator NreC